MTETDDPDEIVGYLLYLRRHPEEQERIRTNGYLSAKQFSWDHVIENLVGKLEFLARKQNIVFPAPLQDNERKAVISHKGTRRTTIGDPVLGELTV